MIPGETILTGASPICGCGTMLPFQVCRSPAGYYIGTSCNLCGPWSRESGYFETVAEADRELEVYEREGDFTSRRR